MASPTFSCHHLCPSGFSVPVAVGFQLLTDFLVPGERGQARADVVGRGVGRVMKEEIFLACFLWRTQLLLLFSMPPPVGPHQHAVLSLPSAHSLLPACAVSCLC